MTPTSKHPARRRALPLKASDLQGLSHLGVDGVLGIINLVEAMHHIIGRRPGVFGAPPAGRTRGITGLVYKAVRGATRLVGGTLDSVLGVVGRALPKAESSPQREAVVAALNGVWGDHLAASGNPLAIPMSLRRAGEGSAGGRVVVLVHGLCMNPLQWTRQGHDHGAALARDLGMDALYLHYNSGLHVSENGRQFAALLEETLAAWPVPVEELVIVAHSMGGLVARSASHYGRAAGHRWAESLRTLVCLGTPHHGAPLERGGRVVDALFGVSPYVAPFARLGKVRSAGITDLRFGNVLDDDWQGRDRHDQRHDDRVALPLPEGVECFAIAGCAMAKAAGARARALGDGLVPVASALGEHPDPARALAFGPSRSRVFNAATHWDLLDRADVYTQLRAWIAGEGRA
jgi:pimeloyl-ACP methyl ester carboxylesterase